MKRSLASQLEISFALIGAILVCSIAANAQSSSPAAAKKSIGTANGASPSSCLPGIAAFPPSAIDPTLAAVLANVVRKPDLMNPAYLKYYLGAPDRGANQAFDEQSSVHYWYDRLRKPRVELHGERDVSTARQANVMVMHMPGEGLDLISLEEMLGPGGKRFFDYNGHPAVMYSFEPHTSVAFVSPHNSFAVRKAVVTYKGPLLPPPSEEDMAIAKNHHVGKLSELASKEQWHDYLHLMREGVLEHPDDPYARVALANALSRTGHVHDAIVEFKQAMAMNPSDQALKQQCYAGLKRLHVTVPESKLGEPVPEDGSRFAAKHGAAPF
ncbi:MAG: hypothetical protein K2W95_31040 [Candidatus Obscuribacterales bacterium]|nr:hypothetical protein [Candidatus Obscuribacterales bacterium]